MLDRTRFALQDKAEYYQKVLQPTAEYLGALLGVEEWAVSSRACLEVMGLFRPVFCLQDSHTSSLHGFQSSPLYGLLNSCCTIAVSLYLAHVLQASCAFICLFH